MSVFDIAAGLVLLVSAIVGWIRGGTREVAAVIALGAAAAAALFALRFTGPIARHAIHAAWLANLAAVLVVFAAVYVLLQVLASALTRRIHRVSGLSGVDRSVGAGFGLARALVVLGLAGLTIGAMIPPDRLPAWISGAALWPVSRESGQALKAFAPRGVKLAREVAPRLGQALETRADPTADEGPAQDPAQSSSRNRDYNDPQRRSLEVRVEKAR